MSESVAVRGKPGFGVGLGLEVVSRVGRGPSTRTWCGRPFPGRSPRQSDSPPTPRNRRRPGRICRPARSGLRAHPGVAVVDGAGDTRSGALEAGVDAEPLVILYVLDDLRCSGLERQPCKAVSPGCAGEFSWSPCPARQAECQVSFRCVTIQDLDRVDLECVGYQVYGTVEKHIHVVGVDGEAGEPARAACWSTRRARAVCPVASRAKSEGATMSRKRPLNAVKSTCHLSA